MLSKKNIIILGCNGLIGDSLFKSKILNEKFNIIGIDKEKKKFSKFFYKLDLINYKKFYKVLESISKKYGKIHSVVNCTYPKIYQKKELLKIDTKLLQLEISNHVGIFFNVMQNFSNFLIKNKEKGVVINFSSIYGGYTPRFEIYKDTKMSMPIQYAICKNSINSMTKYFAKMLNKKNLKFYTISPGGIEDGQNKKFIKEYSKFTNRGMLKKNELNGLVNFLLSEDASKLQGNNFVIDDGFTL
tara:strand:+ start:10187 stop:10915 length:729 start_codon:yes stop_codon:yes gene_type:complete